MKSVALGHETHRGFSDESSWNQNRYRSIGLVTASRGSADTLEGVITASLAESSVHEFAWKDLTTAKRRFAAQKIVDHVIALVDPRLLRLDVLIWDTHDARHGIKGRDDTANLARMYYHLMANVMRQRWPRDALWLQYVDKRTDIDWVELEQCLAGKTRKEKEAAQADLIPNIPIHTPPPTVKQASSGEHVLIQVADLFAGMAAFSWNEARSHREWLRTQSEQLDLLPQYAGASISKSATEKHQVLEYLASRQLPCIVFKAAAGEGLRTYGPSNPINFWKYTPQGEFDRAPLRRES